MQSPFALAAVLAVGLSPAVSVGQNIALNKPIIADSGDYGVEASHPGFESSNVTDGSTTDVFSSGAPHSSTYFLGSSGDPTEFLIIDLEGLYDISRIDLRNSSNSQHNDRGTMEFRISASTGVDGNKNLVSPVLLIDDDLALVNNAHLLAPPAESFPAPGGSYGTFRYIRFDSDTARSNNVALNEIEVFGTPVPEPASLSLLGLCLLALARRRRA